jgi:hypothetical protein
MRQRLRQALLALVLSSALIGGGAVVAHAATSGSTSTTSPSTSSGSNSNSNSNSSSAHCPNM